MATMTDARLESLMLLSWEKDLTDSINIDAISTRWVELKSRRTVPIKSLSGFPTNNSKYTDTLIF